MELEAPASVENPEGSNAKYKDRLRLLGKGA
jgi:hypothetical protein